MVFDERFVEGQSLTTILPRQTPPSEDGMESVLLSCNIINMQVAQRSHEKSSLWR
jgi:hypothetical protein